MIRFPNAKINIGLSVIKKREDGYHDLESIFYPIPWCDILEIIPSNKFEFVQSGIDLNESLENNIVVKAFEVFSREFKIPPVKIALHKNIPTGAGLGGGSSDGTHTLILLRDLFNPKLNLIELSSLALELGSDCPFFLFNKPCHVVGRGEIIEQIDLDLSTYWIKIIHPDIHISTKEAFSNIIPKKSLIIYESINNNYFINNTNRFINDFEESLNSKHTYIDILKNEMYNEGAIYASLTGSGSSVYGIFKSKPDRNSIYKKQFITQL